MKTIDWECESLGVTRLMQACEEGSLEAVKTLIEDGEDIHCEDSYGYTALTYAALDGHKEIVKLLCYYGLDHNRKDKFGLRPIKYAETNGHDDVVSFFKRLNSKEIQPGFSTKNEV